MIWWMSKDHCTDCYFCLVKTTGYNRKNKCKIKYPKQLSAINSVPHSAEIPVLDFCYPLMMKNSVIKMMQILKVKMAQFIRDLISMRWHEISFNQNEKNLAWKRYPTFDSEKVDFCSTFEVTEALCIAIIYSVYWRNQEFQSITQLNGDCVSTSQNGVLSMFYTMIII